MARPWSRRAHDPSPDGAATSGSPTEPNPLDDEGHAWWAQTDVEHAWSPREDRPGERTEERDILADHFGDDWRTTFGFTPPTDEELAAEAALAQRADDDEDPYKVLEVEPTATWDEIVAAHRHQARVHHPDLLVGATEEERARGEERIRVINGAYQELRVRRGR